MLIIKVLIKYDNVDEDNNKTALHTLLTEFN